MIEVNLEKAIQWAEDISNKYLPYYVQPWNEGYTVMSGGQFKRHPGTFTVYNTKDKVIDYKFTDMNDSFSAKDRHIRKLVLRNHVHTSKKIAPSYICIQQHIGGPKVGTILKPFYIKELEWFYLFTQNKVTSQYSQSRMNRLSVYYRNCETIENKISVSDKKPMRKSTRKNNLLAQKIK